MVLIEEKLHINFSGEDLLTVFKRSRGFCTALLIFIYTQCAISAVAHASFFVAANKIRVARKQSTMKEMLNK